MRKLYYWSILIITIIALLPTGLYAQERNASNGNSNTNEHLQNTRETHVTPTEALNVGYTFMRTGTGTRGGGIRSNEVREQSMRLIYTGRAVDSLTGTQTDCYYVFALQPKGFVIVAADNRVEPILGYSYDNNFVVENMPDHVRGWLNNYEKQIEAVVKQDIAPEGETANRWSQLRAGRSISTRSGGTVGPLLTTQWGQDWPYNAMCPIDSSAREEYHNHCPTGCGPTAMAQIINYWRYPTHGRGIHSYEIENYGTLTVNYDSAKYDYDNMPTTWTANSTATEANAVAMLMRDCGVALNTRYSHDGSAIFSEDERSAFINFFKYSPYTSLAEKSHLTNSEWDSLLHVELDNNRPILICSHVHAYVCDGYIADYYHFNFGWSGGSDGWYLPSAWLTPNIVYPFENALLGIAPDSTSNVILGQTAGCINTFTVNEPLELCYLKQYDRYGGGLQAFCDNTVYFIAADTTKMLVMDIIDFNTRYSAQHFAIYDGNGSLLRDLPNSDNDLSPMLSNSNEMSINLWSATPFKLSISQTNGCIMVSDITSSIEGSTLHLSWTENNGATQWQIEYGVSGFELGNGVSLTTTNNPVSISNLKALTDYDFYIRSICDSNHYGLWKKVTLSLPIDLTVSQATVVGDTTIKTRLSWTLLDEADHWEILYVAAGHSMDMGTIVSVNNNPCVLAGIPVGQPLDFYVRAIWDDGSPSFWCSPVSYIPDILHWTDVVTSQPEGYQKDANGNVYISSAEGLSWFSSICNRLNNAQEGNIRQVYLTKDIDLSAYRWTSIDYDWWHHEVPFNGNNHVISGLYCNELSDNQGLFGYTDRNISNVTLTHCNVHGQDYVGAVAGSCSNNNIVNCSVNGDVIGDNHVGGIVGAGSHKIENSSFIGNIGSPSRIMHGGISGYPGDTIVNCYVACELANDPLSGIITSCNWEGDTSPYLVSNCYYKEYETVLPITGNNGTTSNNSGFSGNGHTWTLSTPPYIGGAFHSDLVEALNAWVDANNTDGRYKRWVADTNMVNGGYPVFESVSLPAVAIQDTVMAQGYYSWHGMVFTSDTILTDTLYTLYGYDSVVIYHIFVTPTPITEISVVSCSAYIWNGEIYPKTGDYVQTYHTANDADSVVILHLTITPKTYVDVQRICGGSEFTWIDGVTYTANNNTATYTLKTTDGCDSVMTLHLTFTYNDTTAMVCDSFVWQGITYTESGNYIYHTSNVTSCDSIVTLRLTVAHTSYGDTTAIACDNFDWYEHTDIRQSCEILTHTFTNAAGCDSVVTLHLTIYHIPTVTTAEVSDIATNWVTCGGAVTDDGGAAVIARGVCWSTSQDPTIVDAHTTDGIGTGSFTSNITDLAPNTTYYVRAYATNNGGTSYGEEVTFTTADFTPPTFTCGDNLIVDANSYTTHSYGSQCWMTQNLRNANGSESFNWNDAIASCPTGWHLPTEEEWIMLSNYVDDNIAQDSNISLFLDGLNGKYLWKNKAIPEYDIALVCIISNQHISVSPGIAIEITDDSHGVLVRCIRDGSMSSLPTVTTSVASNIAATSATCGGNVTNDGGTDVTECGVCWSTSENPTIADAHTTDGTRTGIFTSSITDLTPNTTYYVRAYATNIKGTSYGQEVSFITPCDTAIHEFNVTACNSYVWSGTTYTETGDYFHTFTSTYGCDSVVTLHLTINCTTYEDTSAVACESFTWYGTTYTESGDYFSPTTLWYNAAGYDSVVILHLTINQPTTGDTTAVACGSFTWYDTTYTQTGDYTRSLTNAAGCDSIVTLHLTISQIPEVVVTATETSLCVGGSTTLMANVNNFYDDNISYSWSDGIYGSSNTFSPNSSGPFTFTVTATDLPSGCTSTGEITIEVNDMPETPVVTVDNTLIYDGGLVTLSVTNPVADAVYTWYRNGDLIAGATSYVLTDYLTTMDGDVAYYSYTVWAQLPMSGCVSDISANTDVTVAPSPTAVVSVEGNTMFCEGASTTLHVDVTPYHPSYTYQWYMDNELIPGATSTDYVVSEPARMIPYSFHVVVSANGGYTGIAYAPGITVVPQPVVVASISDENACVGGITTLTAEVNGGIADIYGYTYQWSRMHNPDTTVELVAASPVYTTVGDEAAGLYSYWVTATSNYGCSVQSDVVYFTVVSDPDVTISLAGSSTTVCDGGSTAIMATLMNGIGETNYQWYKNGEMLAGETSYFFSIDSLSYGTDDIYTVEVAQTGVGCSSSASVEINTLVTILPQYTVEVTSSGDVCASGAGIVTLTATVNNMATNDVLNYQWYKFTDGQFLPVFESEFYAYSIYFPQTVEHSEYYVVVNSSFPGCSTVSSLIPVNVVAVPSVTIQGVHPVCEGDSLTLNAVVTGGVEGLDYLYDWSWQGADTGVAYATTTIPTITTDLYPDANANGDNVYFFDVIIYRQDNSGCIASTSEINEVNLIKVPSVSVSADNAYVCQNGNVTLTAHASPAASYNYVWTINGQQQAVNAATMTTSIADTGVVNADVVVIVPNALASCSVTASLEVPVQVMALPSVTIEGVDTIVYGQSTTITASGANSYEWNTGESSASITVSPMMTTTYTVTGTNESGCTATESVTVNVNPILPTVITGFVSDVTASTANCVGNVISHGGADVTERGVCWSTLQNPTVAGAHTTDGAGTGSFTSSIIALAPNTTYYVRAYATNSVGTAYGEEMIFATLCDTVVYEFSITTCDSYVWNDDNYTESGDYLQTFTKANGCDSIVTLHLTVNPSTIGVDEQSACESYTWIDGNTYTESTNVPTVTLTNANGCDSVVTLHLTIHFAQSAEFAVTCPDSCYTWNNIAYCTSGDYTQTLQTVHGCDSLVTLHLTITVGLDDHETDDFKVFPNPTNGVVNVECIMHNEEWGGVELHVVDAYGRLMNVVGANNYSPLQTAQIDLSQYANGVYFVKAVADGKVVAVRKVVKER